MFQLQQIVIKLVKVNLSVIACVQYGNFKVCTEQNNGQEKYECKIETCDETCGEDFCRKKIDGQNVWYNFIIYLDLTLGDILWKEIEQNLRCA